VRLAAASRSPRVPADDPLHAAPIEVLAGAVALSRKMLDAAKAGDWTALAALECERSRLFGSELAVTLAGVPANRVLQFREALATCLRLNDETAALTAAHMQRLRQLVDAMAATDRTDAPTGPGSTTTRSPPPERPPG